MENDVMFETNRYFDVPTQVAFWEEESGHYIGGIAYGSEIICGCCGSVVEIEEVYESAPKSVIPIVTYNDWEDFSESIIADNERFFELEEEDEEEDDEYV